MFQAKKNAYLQLVTSVDPRIINKVVAQAMDGPLALRNEKASRQPSLYAPEVDVTRRKLGFGRNGLKLLIRDLHSTDKVIQLRAIHTVMDQVQISESAYFLIANHLVYRLMDLILSCHSSIREKVCTIFGLLCTMKQGRKAITSRKKILENLRTILLHDKIKEVRIKAAKVFIELCSGDYCAVEKVLLMPHIVDDLLRLVKHDYVGIALCHLTLLEKLFSYNPDVGIDTNAFFLMKKLLVHKSPKVVELAFNCLAQILKNPEGKQLADQHDFIFLLYDYLYYNDINVVMSAVDVMKFATLTTHSRLRAKERFGLSEKLVQLCELQNLPMLQLACMQVLINLCDCPDLRYHIKEHLLCSITNIIILSEEAWDGTKYKREIPSLETGHYYRTVFIENSETVQNDCGDNAYVINVPNFLKTLTDVKTQLIRAIHWKPNI